ncbi:MAG: NAD(P)/FAD-dependent oxidoreductase [Armatimonadota bacterium]
MASSKVAILGAGLAGLSAAYHLERDYDLYEAEDRPGGLCRSLQLDGFTFDSAVHVLYSRDDYAVGLIRHLLGNELLTIERSSWVYSHGVHTLYPFQANTYGLPAQVRAECILGLFAAKLAELGRTDQPKSFGDWIQRTFGAGIAEHFMTPMNRKIWGVDPDEMGWEWVIGRIPVPRLEEVVLGALEARSTQHGPNAVFWYPAHGGMEALARAFLPMVAPVKLGARVVRVQPDEHAITFASGAEQRYEKLISSAPLPKLVEMIPSAPAPVREAAAALLSNRVLAVHLGVGRPGLSDKHWIYYPEPQFVFQRISLPSNFAPGLAPPGTSSITAEVTCSRDWSSDDLIGRVVADLQLAGVLTQGDSLRVAHVQELEPAYVVYRPDHRERIGVLREYLEPRGIYSCGRFGDWEYHNMDHAILSGKRAAELAAGRPLPGRHLRADR